MPSVLQDRPHMPPGVWINTSCWFIQDDNLEPHSFTTMKTCFINQKCIEEEEKLLNEDSILTIPAHSLFISITTLTAAELKTNILIFL
jgi:hypothetical protein